MKLYHSSVIYWDKSCKDWLLPMPSYMGDAIGLEKNNFFANFLYHENVKVEANKYELVLSPFLRKELSTLYNFRFKMPNKTEAAHDLIKLIKDEETLYLNMSTINGIDCANPEYSEASAIGIMQGIENQIRKLARQIPCDYSNINRILWKRAKELKLLKIAECFEKTYIGKNKKLHYKGPLLSIEQCWKENYYKPRDSNSLEKEVHINDDEVKICRGKNEKTYITILKGLLEVIFKQSHITFDNSVRIYVTVRLDSERNALSVIIKPPNERICDFEITMDDSTNINELTKILSHEAGTDLRSISSVPYPKKEIKLTISANVHKSKFESISGRVISEYLQLLGDKRLLRISNAEVKPVCLKTRAQRDILRLERDLFQIHIMMVGYTIDDSISHEVVAEPDGDKRISELAKKLASQIEDNFVNFTNGAGDITDKFISVIKSEFSRRFVRINECKKYMNSGIKLVQRGAKKHWFIDINKSGFVIVCFSGNLRIAELGKSWRDDICREFALRFEKNPPINEEKMRNLFLLFLECIVNIKKLSMIKEAIGKYNIESRLGGGKSGNLYLANYEEKKEIRKVAIKVQDEVPSLMELEIPFNEFENENVIKYIEIFPYNSRYYVVMDYVKGLDLKKVIADIKAKVTKLKLSKMLVYMEEILKGVQYLHSRKKKNSVLIHSDLKPANIMIEDESERPIVVDYGLARFLAQPINTLDDKVRDPYYKAPEFYITAIPISQRSDVFSLGLIFYELIMLRHPVNNSGKINNYEKIMKKLSSSKGFNVGKANEVSKILNNSCNQLQKELGNKHVKLVELIRKALSFNPLDRYENAIKMLKEFKTCK
ncbi:MAG: protein kinase [candidate division Zixibacteria bacterium]